MICLNRSVVIPILKILIQLVFLILPILLFGKNSNQSNSTIKSTEKEIEVLLEKMHELKFSHVDSCYLLYDKAMMMSGENKRLQGKTQIVMAWVFFENNKFKEAFKYFNTVLEIGNQIGDERLKYDAYVGLGVVHGSLSNLYEALSCHLQNLKIGKKLNNDKLIARSKLNMGVTYGQIPEYEKSYSYYMQAKEFFDKIEDSYGEALIVNNICRLLLDQKKYKEALQYIEEELPHIDIKSNKGIFCLLQANHAVAKLGNGKMEGLAQLKEAYKEAEKLGKGTYLSSISFKLSKWYLEFGLYDDALEMTKEGIEIGEKYGIIKYLPDLYLNLSEIHRNQKKFEEALLSLEKSNQYKKELSEKKREKEILGKEVMNLLKEEEMENELLQLKNSNQRILNFFLILSFLLIVPYLYFLFRRRQRKQIQKFRQRVAADLHDDVGGNLSAISRIAKGIKDQRISKEVNEQVEELVNRSNQSMMNIVDTVWSLDEKESQLGHLVDKIEDIINSKDFRKDVKEIEYIKNIENEIQILPVDLRHHLLMIFKEGVNNIQKHTFSDYVKIKFQESNKLLSILIYNKFQVTKNPEYSTGRGLKNMEKRVRELGGQINIEKSIDHFLIQINIKI